MKLRVKAGHHYDGPKRRHFGGEEVEVDDRFVRILTSEKCPLEHIPPAAPAKPVETRREPPKPAAGKSPRMGKKDAAPVSAETPAENLQPVVDGAAAPGVASEPPQTDMLAGTYGRRDMRATEE